MRKRRSRDLAPGGRTLDMPSLVPTARPSPQEQLSIRARGKYNARHPVLSRGGVFLSGAEIYREIKRDGDLVKLAELPDEDRAFLESVEEQIGAYKEVGRRWMGTIKQARWLTGIHKRAEVGKG